MNRIIKTLLATALVASTACLQAHTNKTTLIPRSHGVNLALETTSGWYELVHRKAADKFGGNFQAAVFYHNSTNKTGLGKYFGLNNSNTVALVTGGTAQLAANDVSLGYIIHDISANAASAPKAPAATITFNPEQKAVGVYFNYHQDLDKILNGLYLRANLPVVNVSNDMHLAITGANAAKLNQYFSGNYSVVKPPPPPIGPASPNPSNAQTNLTNALIGKDSNTGIADIDILLGYSFINKNAYHTSINLGFSMPAGNVPDGKKLFQAIYGNGQHAGFGGGLDLGARLLGTRNHNLKLHGQLNYRYLFKSPEKRTLGLTGLPVENGLNTNFDQYLLFLDAQASNLNATQLIPAANVLTQSVNVTPGSQLDTIVALHYNYHGFSWDVGYNVFYRGADSVTRREQFDDGRFGIAQANLDMSQDLAIASIPKNFTDSIVAPALSAKNLDTGAASTPSQTTHKVYGGLACITKEWETPLLFGAGGHYEFAAENSAVEGWGVNIKMGISF